MDKHRDVLQHKFARELARNRLMRDVLAAPNDELLRERLRLELAHRRDHLRRWRLTVVGAVAAMFFLAFSSLVSVGIEVRNANQQASVESPSRPPLLQEITTSDVMRRSPRPQITSALPRSLQTLSPNAARSLAVINTNAGERWSLVVPNVRPSLQFCSTPQGALVLEEISDAELLAMSPDVIAIFGGAHGTRRLVIVPRNRSR